MLLNDFAAAYRETQKVDYVGVANLSEARDFIQRQGGDYVSQFPCSLSIGIALPNDIVNLLPHRDERGVQVAYHTHAYDVINQRLDLLISEIASTLQRAGHRAFPIPASERYDDKRICAVFSHKLAASLSGLGWVGKSCLLVTPKHGPRVRWATVLTDAPADGPAARERNRCGTCTQCVDACPVKAFTGRQFSPEEPRESRFRAEACDSYFRELQSKGQLGVCGLCLYACPFGLTS